MADITTFVPPWHKFELLTNHLLGILIVLTGNIELPVANSAGERRKLDGRHILRPKPRQAWSIHIIGHIVWYFHLSSCCNLMAIQNLSWFPQVCPFSAMSTTQPSGGPDFVVLVFPPFTLQVRIPHRLWIIRGVWSVIVANPLWPPLSKIASEHCPEQGACPFRYSCWLDQEAICHLYLINPAFILNGYFAHEKNLKTYQINFGGVVSRFKKKKVSANAVKKKYNTGSERETSKFDISQRYEPRWRSRQNRVRVP